MAIIIIPQALTLPKGIPDQAIVLEVVKGEDFGSDIALTDHPVEPDTANIIKFGSLVDNAVVSPKSESVECVVSDDPNILLVGEIASRIFVALGYGTTEPFSKTVFDRLQLFADNAVVCDIQSVRIDFRGLGEPIVLSEYKNRVITSAKARRTTRQGLDISLTFREVQFAYSSTGAAQQAKTEKAQRKATKAKDAGKKPVETDTGASNKSWWKSIADAVGG